MITTPTYVGIEVAKDRLDLAIRPSGECQRVGNDERGTEYVVSRLREVGPSLVVLEPTGGLEQPLAAALAEAGVHRWRLLIPARYGTSPKRWASSKTEALDAKVLAHFAEVVRPEPRPLPDEQVQLLSATLLRRRQLIAMITGEENRLSTAPKPLRRRIEVHPRWLRKELERANDELERLVRESPIWQEKAALLRSIPPAWGQLSR